MAHLSSGQKSTPHRIVRTVYPMRAVAFAFAGLVVGVLLAERGAPWGGWFLLVLQFIAYPHFAYWMASLAQDGKRAELNNLMIDAVVLGAWAGALGFPTWVTYGLASATTLNNAVFRGLPGAIRSLALFSLCAAAAASFPGFSYQPDASVAVTVMCFFGSLAYASGVGYIVFDRNRSLVAARDALRQSDERYRLITENAGDLIAMLDNSGRWLYNSPSHEKLLSAESLAIGSDAFAHYRAPDAERARRALATVIETRRSDELVLTLVTRNGEQRVLEANLHPILDSAANVHKIVMVSRDVTAFRRQREQLELAAHAFGQMAEAIMIVSAEGTIMSVNKTFSQITGYAAEEVVGLPESDFRWALQPQSFYDEIRDSVSEKGNWTGTTWSRRKDGALYKEWRNVSAVRDEHGWISSYVTLFFDVGEPRLAASA